MAKFNEVIKQLGRICVSNFGECDICDIRPFCPSRTFLDKYAKSGRAERLEEMVMSWAEEHPEPVYETWFEYLLRIGVIPENAPAGGEYQWIVESIKHKHISNDIAESLKLHPKEVQA